MATNQIPIRQGSTFEGAGFNYTEEIPVDFTQTQSIEEKYTPLNGMNSSPYDFVIEASNDFLCMNTMYLEGKFKVQRLSLIHI